MSVDKLLIAEDLIRRSIALESGGGERERAHPRTHKLLADILAGQNQVAQAVTEYQGIMADDVADLRTKKEAGGSFCLSLPFMPFLFPFLCGFFLLLSFVF